VHLAGEHDVVAAALECLADDHLRFATGVQPDIPAGVASTAIR
jgi:hypothetical protein